MKLPTEVLKSNLCDYNDVYILVRGDITVGASPQIQVIFKYCPPFTKCITKIDGTTIDDAENFDLVMPMYNLIEYSSDYSETTGSLWFYSKDEANNFNNNITNTNNFKSFKYKAKLLGNTVTQQAPNAANGILRNAAIAVPLKYLCTFWRSLEMPLINCKVELKLKWTKYYIFSAGGTENDVDDNDNVNNIIFTIKGLAKNLKDQFIGMSIKQKVRIKIQQMNIDIFSNQTLLQSIDYLFYFIQIKPTMLKDLKLENIIYRKVYSKIIMSSSMEKTFMINQLIQI